MQVCIYIYTSKHSQTLHDFLCIPSGNAPSSRPGRSGNSSSTVASSNISKGGGSGATSGGFMMVALGLLLILLMVQKSGKLTSWGSLSHYLQGFDDPPSWLLGISEPSTVGSAGFSSHPTNIRKHILMLLLAHLPYDGYADCIGSESLQWPSESWFPSGRTNRCMIVGMEVFKRESQTRTSISHPKQLDSPWLVF